MALVCVSLDHKIHRLIEQAKRDLNTTQELVRAGAYPLAAKYFDKTYKNLREAYTLFEYR